MGSDWLDDELPVSSRWPIAVAGLLMAAWGGLLVGTSRWKPSREMLSVVAIVNVVVALATVPWLVLQGSEMSGIGIAVVGILGISVLRFAIHQFLILRA